MSKIKLPYLTEVKKAKEIKSLDYLRTYTTKNLNLFNIMGVNRGAENGIETKRVQAFVDMEKDGVFVTEDCFVRVNKKWDVIDGTHHIEKARILNEYVNFMVVPDKMYNDVSEREFANNVSLVNSVDSTWRDKGNITSAAKAGERCALNVLKLVSDTKKAKLFKTSPITATRVISLLSNFETGIKERRQLRSVYCNDVYADILESQEFKVKFERIIEFLLTINRANKNIRGYGVVRQLVIDLKPLTNVPDWNVLNAMLIKFIGKCKDFDKMGDRSTDFKTISNGIIKLLVK